MILRTKRKTAAVVLLAVILLPTLAAAHGSDEHVMGTVTAISDLSVTVKTTTGKTVEVALNAKTTYSRAAQPIQRTDLRVGDRVVIHAGKIGQNLVAHTVQVGVTKH
jgi:hypothetical protein